MIRKVKRPVLLDIDGVNLYCHSLVPMGEEKAIHEMVNGNLAIGDTEMEKEQWAQAAWDKMVKAVEDEEEAFQKKQQAKNN